MKGGAQYGEIVSEDADDILDESATYERTGDEKDTASPFEVKKQMFIPFLNAWNDGLSYQPIQLKVILLLIYVMNLLQLRFQSICCQRNTFIIYILCKERAIFNYYSWQCQNSYFSKTRKYFILLKCWIKKICRNSLGLWPKVRRFLVSFIRYW